MKRKENKMFLHNQFAIIITATIFLYLSYKYIYNQLPVVNTYNKYITMNLTKGFWLLILFMMIIPGIYFGYWPKNLIYVLDNIYIGMYILEFLVMKNIRRAIYHIGVITTFYYFSYSTSSNVITLIDNSSISRGLLLYSMLHTTLFIFYLYLAARTMILISRYISFFLYIIYFILFVNNILIQLYIILTSTDFFLGWIFVISYLMIHDVEVLIFLWNERKISYTFNKF